MADRSVTVLLKAVTTPFTAAFAKAGQSAKALQADLEKGTARQRRAQESIGKGAMVAGGLLVAGFAIAARASMDFEKQLSNVKAVSGATGAEMGRLRDAALKAGKDTVFSASEAAKAEAELAKAGVSTSDILGGALRGSLDLAAAGQLDLAESANISGKAMKIFGLTGKDVGHIADVLAAGANKSAADVSDLGQALAQGGLVARQTGLTLEDTVGVLSAFADRALIGSDAGTSLKTMLQRLNPQSAEAAALMKQLGITAYDAQGNFVGLETFAGRLQAGLGGLSTEQRNAALATVFGSDAVRGANVLYEIGAKGVREYTTAVNDQGAAQRMAATQLDNLSGDLEALKGSLETALIQSGSKANGVLRGMAKSATGLVNAFNDAPSGVQTTAIAMAGLGGAALLVVGGLLVLLPKLAATKAAMIEFGISAGKMRGALKGLGIAATAFVGFEAAVAGFRALQDQIVGARPGVQGLTKDLLALAEGQSLARLGEDFDDFGDKLRRLVDKDALTEWGDAIGSFFHLDARSLREAKDLFTSLDEVLSGLVSSGHSDIAAQQFDRLRREAEKSGVSVKDLRKTLPQYAEALAGASNEQKLAADTAAVAAAGTGMVESAADKAEKALQGYKDMLDGINGVHIAASRQSIGFQESIDSLSESIKENGRSLDTNKAKGRANMSAILDAADAANSHAQAVADETGSVDAGNRVLGSHVVQLRRTLTQLGFNKGKVDALVAAYLKVPKSSTTTTRTPGLAPAVAGVDVYGRKLSGLPGSKSTAIATTGVSQSINSIDHLQDRINALKGKTVTINIVGRQTLIRTPGMGNAGGHLLLAEGGIVSGPSGRDRVPIMATAGEFVVNKAQTERNRPLLERINSGELHATRMAGVPSGPAGSLAGGTTQPGAPRPEMVRLAPDQVDYLVGGITRAVVDGVRTGQVTVARQVSARRR